VPIPTGIASTASTFRFNSEFLAKSYAGLTDEEWLRQPSATTNHILWIVGHVIWARASVLKMLGSPWTRPWLVLFGRGQKLGAGEYPAPHELAEAWTEMSAALAAAFEAVTPEVLAAPAPERIPSFDGTLGGTIGFLAFHESTHVGQAAYLRKWLGYEGTMG
jgi:hypothetical protein